MSGEPLSRESRRFASGAVLFFLALTVTSLALVPLHSGDWLWLAGFSAYCVFAFAEALRKGTEP